MRIKLFVCASLFAVAALASVSAFGQQPAQSAHVWVTGEVRMPGRVMLTSTTMTILDVLALAGGPTNNAADELSFTRTSEVDGSVMHVVVSRTDLQSGTAEVGKLTMQDDDLINVPRVKRFYISGFVKSPGEYLLRGQVTVADAIKLAGGVAPRGTEQGIMVLRRVDGTVVRRAAGLTDTLYPDDEIVIQRRTL